MALLIYDLILKPNLNAIFAFEVRISVGCSVHYWVSCAINKHQIGLLSSPAVVPQSINLPSCVARSPLCHKVNIPSCVAGRPLCHKVNPPRCEAQRRHFIMTCDIFGTGQTNILALCYLFGKTYKPAHSSATQVTEINTFDQITGKVIDVSRTHIPLTEPLMIPLKRVKFRGIV